MTTPPQAPRGSRSVSVVIPCLNERETIGICVDKARRALEELGAPGEVVVSDNGSADGSDGIAAEHGARVARAEARGYGNAYLTGFAQATGEVLVMGDADDTYDFSRLADFVERLDAGYEFVNGTRLKGKILPGAMPWLHRYIGNPVLSWLINRLFHTGFSDSYCGMRAFTRDAYERIKPRSPGMEFALEMIINASKAHLRSTEIPIVYHRRLGQSKLRSFKDGWRSLRFMLLYSPTHLFLFPGAVLSSLGLALMAWLLFGSPEIGGHPLGNHSMVLGAIACILGVQVLAIGIHARTYSLAERFEEHDPLLSLFYRYFNLEKGLLLGFALAAVGVAIYAYLFAEWVRSGFGHLYEEKVAILALVAVVVGVQVITSAFFGSILGLKKAAFRE
ncbi:MAG: glycosyltransferase family 2 protein [Chloroflexota bacterium]